MTDDEDMGGQGTFIMRPEERGIRDEPTNDQEAGDPATLLNQLPPVPQITGTIQMPGVDPLARTVPPSAADFTPSGTAPLGLIAPSELARSLPGLRPPSTPMPAAAAPMPPTPQHAAPFPSNPFPGPPSNPGLTNLTGSGTYPAPILTGSGTYPAPVPVPEPPAEPLPFAADPPKRGILRIALGAVIGLMIMLGIAGVIILLRAPKPVAPAASATAAAAVSEAPSADETASPPPISTPTASAERPAGAQGEAVAALEKLRDSIAVCVKTRIHTLPGTSPTVPSTINWLKNGPYKPLARDWVSPFFSCTNFRIEGPMPFMIQWQFQKPDTEGTGIAWLDENADGIPEKAYAFKGTLVKKDEVSFTEIKPVDPLRKPQKPR